MSVNNAVNFHSELNPKIWSDDVMKQDVQYKLLNIAMEFLKFCKIDSLPLNDVVITGSNAGYTYTAHSDIDLHLLVDIKEDSMLDNLLSTKKSLWNKNHHIKIKGLDVELYVQRINEPHTSAGEYSLLHDCWNQHPKLVKAEINDRAVKQKYREIKKMINQMIKSNDLDQAYAIKDKIKSFRQSGLTNHGELGTENLTFKLLRNNGDIKKLFDKIQELEDRELSLESAARALTEFLRHGLPLNESQDQKFEKMSKTFIDYVARGLKLKELPKITFITQPTVGNKQPSFGQFDPNNHTIVVSCLNRHPMDVFRTLAHEMIHYSQCLKDQLRMDSGATGSFQENEANAGAGIIMRMFGKAHPGFFE